MPATHTRQRILDEALRLFSKRGYDGVSVRDIATAVGIKDSSLYKHFAGKQAIYDTLLADMCQRHNEAAKALGAPLDGPDRDAESYRDNGLAFMRGICRGIFSYYLVDEQGRRFRRMLTMEQFKHGESGRVLRSFMIDQAVEYQAALFQRLMELGQMKRGDAQVLAYQFYAPIYLLWNQYDARPDEHEEAYALLDRHVEAFWKTHTTE